MGKASDALGDYNIYNIYDTCGSGNMTAAAAASSPMATMVEHMARLEKQNTGGVMVGGGPPFPYPCGTGNAVNVWMNNADVRKAINVPPQSFYGNPWPNRGMTYSTCISIRIAHAVRALRARYATTSTVARNDTIDNTVTRAGKPEVGVHRYDICLPA